MPFLTKHFALAMAIVIIMLTGLLAWIVFRTDRVQELSYVPELLITESTTPEAVVLQPERPDVRGSLIEKLKGREIPDSIPDSVDAEELETTVLEDYSGILPEDTMSVLDMIKIPVDPGFFDPELYRRHNEAIAAVETELGIVLDALRSYPGSGSYPQLGFVYGTSTALQANRVAGVAGFSGYRVEFTDPVHGVFSCGSTGAACFYLVYDHTTNSLRFHTGTLNQYSDLGRLVDMNNSRVLFESGEPVGMCEPGMKRMRTAYMTAEDKVFFKETFFDLDCSETATYYELHSEGRIEIPSESIGTVLIFEAYTDG